MKRLFIIVAEVMLILALGFAGTSQGATYGSASSESSNLQKIYPTTSQEYEAIKYVYLLQGHSLPSTTGPWSGDELLSMVENIEAEVTSETLLKMLEAVKASVLEEHPIKTKGIDLEFTLQVALEAYAHTNTDGYQRVTTQGIKEKAFQGRGQWVYGTTSQKPFFSTIWETWAANHFYAWFELNLQNSVHSGDSYSKEVGVSKLSTNVLFLQNLELDLSLFDGNFPNRAFVSAGATGWSLEAGRERLNWGAGKTGNLTISDNLPYHEMARYTTYSNKYKYTFLVSFFPHSLNYWKDSSTGETGFGDGKGSGATAGSSGSRTWNAYDASYGNPLQGLRFYTAHRVEARLFKDKLTLTLTEGLMYMSETNTLDFRALNPVNFNHNNYTASNSNSTFALEADWTIIKGLNVYGQVILDEFAFPGVEEGPSATNRTVPTAMGFLAGVQGAFELKGGIFQASIEFAKTDPYLYLREGVGSDIGYYGIDYIVATRNWSTSSDAITYDEYVLGYTYGPDALVANLNAQWVSSDFTLRLGGNVFFMAHGTHDLWTHWTRIGGTQADFSANDSSPTTTHTSTNNKYPDAQTVRNSVQYSLIYGVNASYAFLDYLTASAQLNYLDIFNYGNEKNVRQSDLQLALSLVYKL